MVDLKSIDFKEILLTGFSVVGALLIVVLLILFGKFVAKSTVGCIGLLLADMNTCALFVN